MRSISRLFRSIKSKSVPAAVMGACFLGLFSYSYAFDIFKGGTKSSASVLEYHNGPRRDGVYIDRTLTKASARLFHLDPSFKARIKGAIYAQLLYVARGGGKGIIIAASEQNNVAAFDAVTGKTLWERNLGSSVPLSDLPCGNIDPLGVTGTPVINKSSGTIYVDAMTTPDGGRTKKHLVYALSLKNGSVVHGWPVDIPARAIYGKIAFNSSVQNQRGALAFVKGRVYVPYGGFFGDCGQYRGWLIGIPASNPASPKAWATGAIAGGSWAPGGAASEGGKIFISTGNTRDAKRWSGGEAILRFSEGPVWSGKPADYFAPENWKELDSSDEDLGGTGPIIVDLPGSKPSGLVVALGKDGKIYLLDRDNLGGIGGQATLARVSSDRIIGAAAAYTTARGTYVVFKGKGIHCPDGQSGDLTAVRLVAGSPPSVKIAWCADQHGKGSPMVTTTDGHSQAIVWSVGAEGDNRLHGFDGDTGQVVYSGAKGGLIGRVRRFQTPILAGGRIYVAADGVIKAFSR